MKFPCRVDGVHFPQDFELTFVPPCDFWGDLGLSNISKEDKKKVWDWIFSLPSDELGIKYRIAIALTINTAPIFEPDKFENMVPGYTELTELEKQEIQRQYFLDKSRNKPFDPLKAIKKLNTRKRES